MIGIDGNVRRICRRPYDLNVRGNGELLKFSYSEVERVTACEIAKLERSCWASVPRSKVFERADSEWLVSRPTVKLTNPISDPSAPQPSTSEVEARSSCSQTGVL